MEGRETTLKKPSDLEKTPLSLGGRKEENPAPINTVVGKLTLTEGPQLEIMARISNTHMITALQLGYIMEVGYNSKFVGGMKDQLLRLSVAKDGLGRRDIIDALEKGSKLPESYYGAPEKTPRIWEED